MFNLNGDSEKPVRVALYARVSSEEQKQGQNIKTQAEFGASFCETFSFQMVEVYLDEAISGTVPLHMRPAGARLLEDARVKRFDIIIVYRLDRLARKLKILLDAWEELDALGIGLRSMTEPLDTSSPLGRFVMQLLGSIAELERETILERTRDGRESVVRRGYWPGGRPPMGYSLKREELMNGSMGRSHVEVNEAEADIIRVIYRTYLEDHMSLEHVSDHLNSQSIPTSTGIRKGTSLKWTGSRVQVILRNPIYKGEPEFYRRRNQGGREHIIGESPPLVEEETWDAVQRKLVGNLKSSPRNAKRFYLLRGIPKCGLCGRSCVGSGRLSDKRFHYVCNGNKNERGDARCKGVRIRAEALEELVWKDIEGYVRNPGEVVKLLAEKMKRDRKETSGVREGLAKLDEDIRTVERRRQWVIDHASRGLISDDEAEQTLLNTQRELQVIQTRRKALMGELELVNMHDTQMGQTEALLATLADKVESADDQTKRTMVEALVQGIVLTPGENGGVNVNISYRFGQIQERFAFGFSTEGGTSLRHTRGRKVAYGRSTTTSRRVPGLRPI